MERFFGFDLGDAESAVSVLKKDKADVPQVLRIRGTKSFITAYARLSNQELIIGEDACYNPDAVERKLRFDVLTINHVRQAVQLAGHVLQN